MKHLVPTRRLPKKRARPNTNQEALDRLEIHAEPLSEHQWLYRIEPYPYTFESFAKARWIGRSILSLYSDEFRAYPESYYKQAIEQGRIQVVKKYSLDPITVACDYQVQGGDKLIHTVHRHEPSVSVQSNHSPFVTIVEETDDIIAVDKPSTLPVHPCGGYHQNSLVHLLERCLSEREQQKTKLFTIHRLDRLTSGLVILAKNSEASRRWNQAILERERCAKLYLARVKGRFPKCMKMERIDSPNAPVNGEWIGSEEVNRKEDARKRNAYGYWVDGDGGALNMVLEDLSNRESSIDSLLAEVNRDVDVTAATDVTQPAPAWLHLACPVRIANHKDGGCEYGSFVELSDEVYEKTVKAAQTSFAVVRYDVESDSTIVLCRPHTGRTHQIRLHLQATGHPIANDPNYGGELWYGDPEGRLRCQEAQNELDRFAASATATCVPSNDTVPGLGETKNLSTKDDPATEAEIAAMVQAKPRDLQTESLSQFIERTCVWCARCRGQSLAERSRLEFLVRSPGIWLHALRYRVQVGDQTFQCRTVPPFWALEPASKIEDCASVTK